MKTTIKKLAQKALIKAGGAPLDPTTGMTEEELRAGPSAGRQIGAGIAPGLSGILAAPSGMRAGAFARGVGYGAGGVVGGAVGTALLYNIIELIARKGKLSPGGMSRLEKRLIQGGAFTGGVVGAAKGLKQTYRERLRDALEAGNL